MSGFQIIGIDPSLTATGLARIRPGDPKPIRLGCVGTPAVAAADHDQTLQRLRTLTARVLAWVREGREDGDVMIVAIEAPIYPGKKMLGMYHTRAGLWWMLLNFLSKEATIVVVEPTKLKSYVARKGTASKDEMLATIAANFPDLGVTDNNEADALGLACMVARELGYPMEPSVQRCNPAALEGLRWPQWVIDRRGA